MSRLDQDEYIALRVTIRERGTARVCVFAGGIAAWTAATIATAALASTPVATLLPLLLLAATFEAVFALHVGVERIGRYLQVYYEADAGGSDGSSGTDGSGGTGRSAGWEHAAMAFGRPAGAATTDALFSVMFLIATLFNAAPALVAAPAPVELIFVGGAHALFALRLLTARMAAGKQRAIDLARFQQLKRRG